VEKHEVDLHHSLFTPRRKNSLRVTKYIKGSNTKLGTEKFVTFWSPFEIKIYSYIVQLEGTCNELKVVCTEYEWCSISCKILTFVTNNNI